MKKESMGPMIQPEEAKRLASMPGPEPATVAARPESMPMTGRARLAQAYAMLARKEQPGANDALVALVEQARTDCLGARGMPKDIPSAEVLTDKMRVTARKIAGSGRSPAEMYADLLDAVTDELRRPKVKRAA